MTVLPLSYLPSVGWFEHLFNEECVIDVGEHYVKQSCRNRCHILTAQGVAMLTAPVVAGGSREKKRMSEVRLAHTANWERQHWHSLHSAYGRAPYFEHYADRFAHIYERHYEWLVDFNLDLLTVVTNILKCSDRICLSKTYVTQTGGAVDLRNTEIASTTTAPYIQVFADRHPFVPNLSIVDAVFNGQI